MKNTKYFEVRVTGKRGSFNIGLDGEKIIDNSIAMVDCTFTYKEDAITLAKRIAREEIYPFHPLIEVLENCPETSDDSDIVFTIKR